MCNVSSQYTLAIAEIRTENFFCSNNAISMVHLLIHILCECFSHHNLDLWGRNSLCWGKVLFEILVPTSIFVFHKVSAFYLPLPAPETINLIFYRDFLMLRFKKYEISRDIYLIKKVCSVKEFSVTSEIWIFSENALSK